MSGTERKSVDSGQEGDTGTTIEYTEVEQTAMKDGWIPPDRFDEADTGKNFISAEKFVENGSFFKKINSQKERIEQLEGSFKQLNSHYEKVAESEHLKAEAQYKEEIASLKAEKIKAINEGEGELVVAIEEKIEQIEKPVLDKPEADPVFDNWAKDNSWYQDNQFLAIEADIIAEKYLAKGLRGKELLDTMTDHIKISQKEHFNEGGKDDENNDDNDDNLDSNGRRTRSASVEGDTNSGNKPRKNSRSLTPRDLTPEEREVFTNFDRMGIFADDKARTKYFNEVVDLRD